MHRASLPILMTASPAVRKLLGPELSKVAVLAVQAILRHRRGIEVAHQQISYRKHHVAFSSRIGRHGDLICRAVVETPVRLTGEQRELLQQFESTFSGADAAKHSPRDSNWLDGVKRFWDRVTS